MPNKVDRIRRLLDKRPKRPRDPAQLAKLIVDIAMGEVDERPSPAKRGRRGGQTSAKRGLYKKKAAESSN